MLDIHNFYIVISNMQKEKNKACKNGYNFVKYNCLMIFVLIGVYWQIKRIQVSEDAIKDPYKFDKMIRALRSRKAVPKYSSVLWEDPKKQQWKRNTAIKWAISHRIGEGYIRLRMYEERKEIIDTTIKRKGLLGGRLGIFFLNVKILQKIVFIFLLFIVSH